MTGVAGHLVEANARADAASTYHELVDSPNRLGKKAMVYCHGQFPPDNKWMDPAQPTTYAHLHIAAYFSMYYEGFSFIRGDPNWRENWARGFARLCMQPTGSVLYLDSAGDREWKLPSGKTLYPAITVWFKGSGPGARSPGPLISPYVLTTAWADDVDRAYILTRFNAASDGANIDVPAANILANYTPARA